MLDFKFPDVGEGIHEGTIVKWRVKDGDEVKSDQVLVEIETDKAIVEIPAPRSGVIAKTFHKENEVIKVGESLVIITDKGEAFDPSSAAATSPAPVPVAAPASSFIPTTASTVPATSTPAPGSSTTPPAPEKGPGVVGSIDASNTEIPPANSSAISARAEASTQNKIPATAPNAQVKILPSTRVLATKLGVDLTKITPTGANGMITDNDVMAAKNISPQPLTSTSEINTQQPKPAAPPPAAPKTFPGEVSRTPYKGIRKTIGDRMVESHTHTVPVTHFDTIDITKLVARREAEKQQAQAKNIKLTYLAYIAKAVTDALKEFPIVNSELDEATQEIITKNYYNIGIAVDTDDGLLVPVIKDADKKDLFTIAKEITALADLARTKKLTAQDMQNGTFTITNYGSIGGDFATPVINYPQAAILGIGKIKDSFAFDTTTTPASSTSTTHFTAPSQALHPIKTLGLALTFDHRLLDGAIAARFVNAVAQKLQL